MEKRYSEIIGMQVVAHDSLRKAGKVKHLLLDTEKGLVVAFLLGIIANSVVVTGDVIEWNGELVIPSAKDIVPGEEVARVKRIQSQNMYVLTKKVYTEGGDYLGRVYDYAIDSTFFELRKLYVRRSLLWFFGVKRYLVGRNSIIEVTKKKVIVKDSVLRELDFNFGKKLSLDY